MANLIDIKRRIKSVKNTQQITKAMKMVAAAKVRKAQEAINAARPYAVKVEEVVSGLASKADPAQNPLLASRDEKRVTIVTVTSDKGLCGGFNGNVIRRVLALIEEKKDCERVDVIAIGKKGRDVLKAKGHTLAGEHVGLFKNLDYAKAAKISAVLMKQFENAETDSVYLVYNEFKSLIAQVVKSGKVLPVVKESEGQTDETDYLYEPTSNAILDSVLKKYVEVQLFRALLESAAGEHGARMTAMDSATKNASEMIGTLTLSYNRARQANITRELIEIISGADALG
ncbi:MAG: ATP synthase F1 subunit gamma [Nitrospinota bacterium]